MIKFRSKIFFALIALIIIFLLGLGLLLGELFKNYYMQSFDERLKKECNFLRISITENGSLNNLDLKKFEKAAKTLDVQLTVINNNGIIQYDSGNLLSSDTNLLKNEIKGVIRNKAGNQVNMQVGDQSALHYYWTSITFDGKKTGYILLSAKTNDVKNAYEQIWWILTLSIGIVSLLIILLGIRIRTSYTKPIASATSVAIELAKGNYRARTSVDRMNETGILNSSINILARNLQEMVKSQEMQQDRLSVLIENIEAGLILIDSRGYINLINKGYKEIFQVDPSDYIDQLYYEVIEHQKVARLIEEVFITEQKVNKQLHLTLSIERRFFDVYGVPIIGTNNVWKGVLLVFYDITEMKKLEQMRKDFVANVSHELKTPVTSIKGFSETLLDGAMDDRKALREFLSIILKESDRLQSLIQDLLELSKIEQQNFNLNVHEFDLVQALREIITILSSKAEEKNIDLELQSKQEGVILSADVHRLQQVFINLIANAIAYTPKKGKVLVTVKELDDVVLVNVKDTGIGIDKNEIPRIFERFYRIDRDRSRNSGGTGLGLAIVKHIIEAHHGKIHVISEIGKGSEFIIELRKSL